MLLTNTRPIIYNETQYNIFSKTLKRKSKYAGFFQRAGVGVSPVKERMLKFSPELSTECRKAIRLDRNFHRYQEGDIGNIFPVFLNERVCCLASQQGWYREDIFPVPSYLTRRRGFYFF